MPGWSWLRCDGRAGTPRTSWTVAGESLLVDGIALLAPWQVYAVELRGAADDLLTQQRMI